MNLSDRISFFEENYDLLSCGGYGSGKKIYIGKKNEKCRFCGKNSSETRFSNDSHAIPQFLGNRQLIILEECDECNKFFSENLEDNLDKYTKPFRVFAHIRGANKIPAYRSKDKMSGVSAGTAKEMTIYHNAEGSFITGENGNSFKMHFDIEPHIPAAAYKALVKIGLSLIEEEKELSAFSMTIKWIRDKDHSRYMLNPLTLMRSFIPGFKPTSLVTAILLRRKPLKTVPYALLVIVFGNWIYQLHIPSHLEAENGQAVTYGVPWFPTPFEVNWPMGELKSQVVDLTSHEKLAFKETIVVQFSSKEDTKPA